MSDFYSILGVPPGATKDEIKRAGKRLKQRFHPDRPEGDEAKFKQVNAAVKLLTNDSARKRYDETGSSEDRPEEITDEMHAISILSKIFIAILEQDQHGGDLIHVVKVEIAKGMREGPKYMSAHKRKITKAEKILAKSLKQTAGKPGYLQNVLTTHIAGLKAQLAQMELAHRIGPLMQEILKDYRWEGDAPVNPYSTGITLDSLIQMSKIINNLGP